MNSNTAAGDFSKTERKITTFHPPADVQNFFSRQKKTPKQLGVSREHTRLNGSRCSVISGGSGRWDTPPTAAFCQPQHWLFTRDITLYMRATLQLSRLAPVCFLAWNWRRDTTPAAGWVPGITLGFTRDVTLYQEEYILRRLAETLQSCSPNCAHLIVWMWRRDTTPAADSDQV